VPPGVEAVTVNVYAVFDVSPVTVIGDAPEPVPPEGLDVTVNVTTPEPRFVGAVYVTVAVVEVTAVAVPIVGAPGVAGQMPCFTKFVTWSSVQMPLAAAVVGATGFLVINPPGYFWLMAVPYIR
jgi:hypothetical protein